MYKKLEKIVISHLMIILFWGLLFKNKMLVEEGPILNAVSLILFFTLYGLIYTEISNKKIPQRFSILVIFTSLLPLSLILINDLLYKAAFLFISLISTSVFIKRYLNLDNIKYVSIFVEGKIFNKLPNSNKKINTVLDRNIGINKEYNISNITNTTKTTIYYLSKYNDFYYYVPVTKIQNEDSSKIEIIIKELTSSNLLNTNLISYLNSNTELLSYNETDKSLFLNFNENILEDINTNNILEEVSYSINLSIKDNYDVNNVVYYVNDKVISTFNIK